MGSRGRRIRYSPWRGGADPLAPPFDVRRAVDEIGDRVLAGESIREALREVLANGLPDETGRRHQGVDALRARAARLRREAARRGRLDGTLTRAAALLDQALAAEREELENRQLSATDDAQRLDADFAAAQLNALPSATAAAVRELTDYRWSSHRAEQLYRQILEELRSDVLDQQFAGLRDTLAGMRPGAASPEQRAAMNQVTQLLHDLNALLDKHSQGTASQEDFERFMAKHGESFGEEAPENIEDLIDSLAQRAATAQQLMNSLTPQQQQELATLVSGALGDSELASQLAALSDRLQGLRPQLGWTSSRRMTGQTPLGYADATQALTQIADLEAILTGLDLDRPGASLDDVDVDAVERSLGNSAARQVRHLAQLERELRAQGWLTGDRDQLSLTPKALRRLGDSTLNRVFSQLSSSGRGEHDLRDAGAAGAPTGASRAWEFGDTQPLDVVRTIGNAVLRTGPSRDGVTLEVADFEVVETERRAGAAVALCVDVSFSMVAEGRWGPMKQTALALAHLAETRYPEDAVQIIAFGRYAMPIDVAALAGLESDFVQGTNLHHALQLAGRHLRRHSDAEPVVLVVTDGEPTAHLDGAEAVFSYPPLRATIAATLAEVDALTRYGAAINVFLLGEDVGLRRFTEAIVSRNGGRLFAPSVQDLSGFVVRDYLRARAGRRRAG